MLIEVLKTALSLLGGGVAGAFLNEWMRRRRERIQSIPLIERVNRLVSPKLEGFTLARKSEDGKTLEPITNVREYQFTLRNTSNVHLQDVEIQFEFPSQDVEGWAERPTLSKTAPIGVDADIAKPLTKSYRWRIPQLPSTDSIDFTFRAIDPTVQKYEVALYKSGCVVIQKFEGEPVTRTSTLKFLGSPILNLLLTILITAYVFFALNFKSDQSFFSLREPECTLAVTSSFDQLNDNVLPWRGPWRIHYSVLNTGTRRCVLQSDELPGTPTEIEPAQELSRTTFSSNKPKLVARNFKFGQDSPTRQMEVTIYAQAQ
ncbi:MAG TPA: hypothetical protein VGD64_16040 [Acidisarcina sp.]